MGNQQMFMIWILGGWMFALAAAGCATLPEPSPSAAQPLKSGVPTGEPPTGAPGASPDAPEAVEPAASMPVKSGERISAHPTPPVGEESPLVILPGWGKPASFQVILEGAALASSFPQPLTLAFQPAELLKLTPTGLLAGLPAELSQGIQAAAKTETGGLFILIYAGEMPSGGFSIAIDSILAAEQTGKLLVTWKIVPPKADQGAITALTYPYLLVRVDGAVEASQVVFERVGE